MSFISTLTILTLCGVAFGGYLESNSYIDSVLVNTRQQLQSTGADPYKTNGWVYEFKDKIKIIGTVKGKATYDSGEIKGLSRVARQGDCNAPFRRHGGQEVEINCTLVFDALETEHHGKLKYGKTPKVSIKGKGEFGKVLVEMVAKQRTPYSPPFLERLSVKQMGAFKPSYSGLGPLNKFLSILKEDYTGRMNAEIINAINQPFFHALNRTLPSYQMPQY